MDKIKIEEPLKMNANSIHLGSSKKHFRARLHRASVTYEKLLYHKEMQTNDRSKNYSWLKLKSKNR